MENQNRTPEDRNAEPATSENWSRPPCDVCENNDEWLIIADVPGSDNSALKLEMNGSELVIEARVPSSEENRPRSAGYRRVFSLPPGIDSEAAEAKLAVGVLFVHLPKKRHQKPHKIKVSGAGA